MYLTDEQRRRLKRRADDTGSSEAEVIRSILDEALGIDSGTSDAVAAVLATAGICRDYPDWPEWLRDIRGRTFEERRQDLGP